MMSEDIVKIKGTKAGLQLSFASGAKFEDIKSNILGKLESGNSFFIRGTTVYIPSQTLPKDQMEVLRRTFHQHGMLFRTELPKIAVKVEPTKKSTPDEDAQEMIVINRTLRGGQEVKTRNSVLMCGNVHVTFANRSSMESSAVVTVSTSVSRFSRLILSMASLM